MRYGYLKMKAVIIEDEPMTAEDLAKILVTGPEKMEVVRVLTSVKEAIAYFNNNLLPDIIFCDIELGDGYSFEIFKRIQINVPVIFCTAYHKYALEAFENNGIGYVLKPFTQKSIQEAVEKYRKFKSHIQPSSHEISTWLKSLHAAQADGRKTSYILINYKDKIIPVKHEDIAILGMDHKSVFLTTFSQQKFHISYTLEELETTLGQRFYRANRQFLISREVIQEAVHFSTRKLLLKLKIQVPFEVTVAKAKIPEFLGWLKG